MKKIARKAEDEMEIRDVIWDEFRIDPNQLKNMRVLESSVYLTRSCNLKCQYCKIVKTELPEELSIEKWMEVMDLLEELGVMYVNIAGGEPTILKGLGRLISHLNGKKNLKYSLVSNSMFNDRKFEELVSARLQAYVASVDVLSKKEQNLHDLKKASAGIKMLERLKAHNIPYLCANIVISGTNIDNVMSVVEFLNDSGYFVNVCPIIWGKGDKWDKVEAADRLYRLRNEHREKLVTISEKLIQMKRAGANIIPTESYLSAMPDYAVNLDWHCSKGSDRANPPRLTIDADGSLMTCINMRGETSKKFSIFDLREKENYDRYVNVWREESKKCSGCYWSTMVMARERQDMLEALNREIAVESRIQAQPFDSTELPKMPA